jgi:hypothetical protein
MFIGVWRNGKRWEGRYREGGRKERERSRGEEGHQVASGFADVRCRVYGAVEEWGKGGKGVEGV